MKFGLVVIAVICMAFLILCGFLAYNSSEKTPDKMRKEGEKLIQAANNEYKFQVDSKFTFISYKDKTKLLYKIIEIDGHEYISSCSSYGYWIIGPHFQNCKCHKESNK